MCLEEANSTKEVYTIAIRGTRELERNSEALSPCAIQNTTLPLIKNIIMKKLNHDSASDKLKVLLKSSGIVDLNIIVDICKPGTKNLRCIYNDKYISSL